MILAILSTSTMAQFYTIYDDFLRNLHYHPQKVLIYKLHFNYFASLVYNLQPEFGQQNNLQNSHPPLFTITIPYYFNWGIPGQGIINYFPNIS